MYSQLLRAEISALFQGKVRDQMEWTALFLQDAYRFILEGKSFEAAFAVYLFV